MSLGKHGQLYIASPNEPGICEFHLSKTALYRTIGSSTLTARSAVALNAFKSHLWATDLCCGGMWHVFGFKVPGGLATGELNIRPEALGLSGIAAYPPPSQSTVPIQNRTSWQGHDLTRVKGMRKAKELALISVYLVGCVGAGGVHHGRCIPPAGMLLGEE
jgi:hypothetical protein